jgi:hypothetical protein
VTVSTIDQRPARAVGTHDGEVGLQHQGVELTPSQSIRVTAPRGEVAQKDRQVGADGSEPGLRPVEQEQAAVGAPSRIVDVEAATPDRSDSDSRSM